MAQRSFGSLNLVELPRLDGNDTLAIARAIAAAAVEDEAQEAHKAHKKKVATAALADGVTSALADLAADVEALQAEQAKAPPVPPGVKQADTDEDTAVGAIYDILQGWARLASKLPEAAGAKAVLDEVFDGGIGFVRFPVKREWAVVETKLALLAKPDTAAAVTAIGAAPVLDHLRAVHVVYGQVIGTTKAPAPVVQTQLGVAINAVKDSVRTYVIRVAATVDRKHPETQALADRLLQPIVDWESHVGSAAKPAPAPSAPSTPAPAGDGSVSPDALKR